MAVRGRIARRSGGALLSLGLTLAALGLTVDAGAAFAEEPADDVQITWAVQPSSANGPDGRDALQYSLGPGETTTDYVGVSNLGAEPVTVRVYAMDALMTADGAFSLPPAGTASEDVGTWVGIDGDGVFTIEPGTRTDIPFRLTLPPNAEPGDHAGGIVASLAELAPAGEGGQQVAVDRRVGVRVYVDVPGEAAPQLVVSDVEVDYRGGLGVTGGPAVVSYTVSNPGNQRLGGDVRVDMSGPFGWLLSSAEPQELPELIPGGEVRLSQEFAEVPPAMLLTGSVDVEPRQREGREGDVAGVHHASGTAWAVPWLIVAGLLVVIAVIVLLVRRGRRLRRRLREAEAAVAAAAVAGAAGAANRADEASESPREPAGVGTS